VEVRDEVFHRADDAVALLEIILAEQTVSFGGSYIARGAARSVSPEALEANMPVSSQ